MHYHNKETKTHTGGKTVREVLIKGNKGTKTITKYTGGRKISTVRKPILRAHIMLIQTGKFVPGLFKDCVRCNRTRKNRRV